MAHRVRGGGDGPELATFGEGERSGAHHVRGVGTGRSLPRLCLMPRTVGVGFTHLPTDGSKNLHVRAVPLPAPSHLPRAVDHPSPGRKKLEVKITSPQGIVPALGWIVSAGLRRKSQWRGRPGLWVPSPSRTRDTQSSHHSERRKGPEREGTGLDPSDEVPGSGSLSRRLVRPGRGGPGESGTGVECP